MSLKSRIARVDAKLLLAIVGLGSCVAASVGVAAYISAFTSLENDSRDRLSAVLQSRKSALQVYLRGIEEDLTFVASHPWTASAVDDFDRAWDDLGGDQTEKLQKLYIKDNPHPTGAKENLDRAPDSSTYSKHHATYHPWFRQFLRERDYYDVFLFDIDGNLLYSVYKELDYATNLNKGRYRESDLGNAFRAALKNPETGSATFFDFRAYAPSHGAPASFISKPILDTNDNLAGVLIFQMPINRLNEVFQEATGLGATGDSYLVGRDGLMRTDSRFSQESTILSRRVENQPVERALSGQTGIADLVSFTGKPSMAAFAPIEFKGVTWAIVAEIESDEILASANALLLQIAGITTLALLSLTAVGWFLGRNIACPLQKLTTTVASLARGERAEIPGADRADEIGELARSLDQVYRKGLEAARLKAALNSCQVNVMVANRGLEIVYINPVLEQLFKSAEADIKKDLPQFSADRLLGENISAFHKNPAHQQAMLGNLHASHNANIVLGGRKLSLAINPVMSDSNERLGTVVEWQDKTAELTALEEVDNVVTAASRGDLSRRLELEDKQGFMLSLAKSINQLTSALDEVTSDVSDKMEGLAGGDLSQRVTTDYQGSFGDLKASVNRMADQLSNIVTEIQTAADEVKNAASEISSGTEDLSHRTEQAASSLEQTAASMEEMAASVKETAQNSASANHLSNSANNAARDGGEVVEQVVKAMDGIESSARKMTDIISVIDEIAFQTNLLALNASVEAARAGEAGKGFAVVAQEVRQLAQRSADAASDIKVLIQDSNVQVKDGVELVNRAGGSLSDIVSSIGSVAEIIQGISNASQEQASGVQEINGSVASMDEMTQQNSALVEESSAAARALSDQAGRLSELMAFFKLDRTTKKPRTAVAAPERSNPASNARLKTAPVSNLVAATDDGWDEF